MKDHSPDYVLNWKIRNTISFGRLMRGEAEKEDLSNLIACRNITEALLVVCGIKNDDGTLARSAVAIIDICERYATGKKALYPAEIQALRDVIQLHDEIFELITVKQMEDALTYAKREIKAGRVNKIKAPK